MSAFFRFIFCRISVYLQSQYSINLYMQQVMILLSIVCQCMVMLFSCTVNIIYININIMCNNIYPCFIHVFYFVILMLSFLHLQVIAFTLNDANLVICIVRNQKIHIIQLFHITCISFAMPQCLHSISKCLPR